DDGGTVVVPAAHDHPVADGHDAQLVQRRADLVEHGERQLHPLPVVGDGELAGDRHLVGAVLDPRPVLADALDDPRGQRGGRRGLDDPVLDRRRPGGADEAGRGHGATRSPAAPAGLSPAAGSPTSWAWMAVMATVLTMSRTVAPRDRSLTGLASPWSTGPIATAPADRCTAL